jgi:hypothetical protein
MARIDPNINISHKERARKLIFAVTKMQPLTEEQAAVFEMVTGKTLDEVVADAKRAAS